MNSPQNTQINQAIQTTIIWFDMFDFPLTVAEIWRFLPIQAELNEVINILNSQKIPNISQSNGFYFASGRQAIISTRLSRQNHADRKYKKAIKLFRCFGWLPWIKLAAMANLMGPMNLRDESDIDLFIITSAKRLWLTRLIMSGTLKLLKLRPGDKETRDTYCLSFLIAENNLDLQKFCLPNDYYFYYWLANLTPFYEQGNIYQQLITANPWLHDKFPNWQAADYSVRRYHKKNQTKLTVNILDRIEKLARDWQIKILAKELANLMNLDTRVVINEHTLKLHAKDRRDFFNHNYEKLCASNCKTLSLGD